MQDAQPLALTPPPGNPRFPLLDSVRALAALAIVAGHVYHGGHGYLDTLVGSLSIGVQIFFALSGFVLLRPALAALARGEAPLPVGAFLRRRALRILPAYWFALTVCGLLFADSVTGVFSDRWWVFYGFGQSFSITDKFHGLAVAWSLSVEVVFYLVLPVLVALIARLAPRVGLQAAAWCAIGPLFVLGPVVHLLNAGSFDSRSFVLFVGKLTYAFPGETNFFAAGMALAVLSVRGTPPRVARWPGGCWAAAVAVYVVMATFFGFVDVHGHIGFQTRFVVYDLLTMVIAWLVLLPAAFDERPGVPRTVLRWPPLVFTGVVSYAVYLWHVPLLEWLVRHRPLRGALDWRYPLSDLTVLAVVLALTLLVASFSYSVVESPFLRLKARTVSARSSFHE